jgi:hypothetical protein
VVSFTFLPLYTRKRISGQDDGCYQESCWQQQGTETLLLRAGIECLPIAHWFDLKYIQRKPPPQGCFLEYQTLTDSICVEGHQNLAVLVTISLETTLFNKMWSSDIWNRRYKSSQNRLSYNIYKKPRQLAYVNVRFINQEVCLTVSCV